MNKKLALRIKKQAPTLYITRCCGSVERNWYYTIKRIWKISVVSKYAAIKTVGTHSDMVNKQYKAKPRQVRHKQIFPKYSGSFSGEYHFKINL